MSVHAILCDSNQDVIVEPKQPVADARRLTELKVVRVVFAVLAVLTGLFAASCFFLPFLFIATIPIGLCLSIQIGGMAVFLFLSLFSLTFKISMR